MTIRHHVRLYATMILRRVFKRAEKFVRIARYHILACARDLPWLRARLYLPRNDTLILRAAASEDLELHLVEPEHSFERLLPLMPAEVEIYSPFVASQRGVFPAAFLVKIRNGRFWGNYGGAVFTSDGRLIAELSKDIWGTRLHSAYVKGKFPKPSFLPGRTLSLVTPEAASNYHHWMMDLMPRAGLVERAGFKIREFDQILIKDGGLPFQVESLRRLGVVDSQLVRVNNDFHAVAASLTVPAVRHDNTKVSRSDMEFVRRLFLPDEAVPYTARRRLYLSRRDAAFRRILNEDELLPLLKKHGFEEVVLSNLSVAEQAKLFSEAHVVIGANGSAFANLLFAHPSCQVIEMFAPGWVVAYNWMICANFGLRYTALIGKGPRPATGELPREIKQDIYLDLDIVEKILRELPAESAYQGQSLSSTRGGRS